MISLSAELAKTHVRSCFSVGRLLSDRSLVTLWVFSLKCRWTRSVQQIVSRATYDGLVITVSTYWLPSSA